MSTQGEEEGGKGGRKESPVEVKDVKAKLGWDVRQAIGMSDWRAECAGTWTSGLPIALRSSILRKS